MGTVHEREFSPSPPFGLQQKCPCFLWLCTPGDSRAPGRTQELLRASTDRQKHHDPTPVVFMGKAPVCPSCLLHSKVSIFREQLQSYHCFRLLHEIGIGTHHSIVSSVSVVNLVCCKAQAAKGGGLPTGSNCFLHCPSRTEQLKQVSLQEGS